MLIAPYLFSCDSFIKKRNNSNSFYTNTGGFDRPRIPLVEPYELVKVSSGEWRMELLTTMLLTLSVHNVKGVSVINGKIMLYSEGGTEVGNKQYERIWFIVNPEAKSENAFSDYKVYSDSLKKLGIKDTSLNLPDKVYKGFSENRKLKWR